MLKNFLQSSFAISFFLLMPIPNVLSSEVELKDKILIENLLSQKIITFDDLGIIITQNNLELKSLEELVSSASYNLSSKISKRYPSIDLSANGLPQYLYGKNYSNSSTDTKTSQLKLSPSINIRWDLIDPQRGLEISSAKDNYEIAKNNYNIKRNDLIQEARLRFHKYQQATENAENAYTAVELSNISLKDAEKKLEVGIGTKFDVLEAQSQLARDKQNLEEQLIAKEIKLISLKEILNLNLTEPLTIKNKQKLIGFWNYPLDKNINHGIQNSLSLKNIKLQKSIKQNQAKTFKNANLPFIYISNTLSSSVTKGSALTGTIDPDAYTSGYTNKISLNFSWNIFTGGKNKNSFKAKQSEAKAENYSYLNFENQIKTNISEAYLNLIKNQKKLISTKQEILSSTESLRLARLRYEVGISTLKDVLVRQEELTKANTKRINAIFNYNVNLDKLEKLTFFTKSQECINLETQIKSICNY